VGVGDVRRPELLVFDVNETLSDLAPVRTRFAVVGLEPLLVRAWFAGVLRDGMALAAHGDRAPFADLARETLRAVARENARAPGAPDLDAAVEHVMAGFLALPVHPDVVPGLRALREAGIRMVTLSNGAVAVAEGLLGAAGVGGEVERMMSVEQAGFFKPDPRAYGYAVETCGVEPSAAMLVAVHPWDTDGALRAGLRAAWVDRGDGHYPAYFRAPTLTVSSISDLAERLA
jgi:2-haloacid dehalogenase